MTYQVPTAPPASLRQGDTFWFERSFGTFNTANGFTATLTALHTEGQFRAEIVGSDDGAGGYQFRALSTANWPIGRYTIIVRAQKDGEGDFTVYETSIDIAAGVGKALDLRSVAQISLDAIDAYLRGDATPFQTDFTVEGISITKMTAEERIRWRDYFRAEVARENRRATRDAGGPNRNKIRVRFI